MAAGIPEEKSVELIKVFENMLKSRTTFNEFSYHRFLREIGKVSSPNSVSALGLFYAVAGDLDKSNSTFDEACHEYNHISVCFNHLMALRRTGQASLLKNKSYEYADRYESKELSVIAYTYAYWFGDREGVMRYMDRHIRLLSAKEGRELAEKQKEELLSELSDAYETSGCSEDQFERLALLIFQVAKNFDADIYRIEASKNGNSCYIADINNKDPKTIAEMNYALAEVVCSDPVLDDCNLIGRFSPQRQLHGGAGYVYKQQ
ncbi:hypothetical protein D0065_08030 [Salmonella enterica]|nr:hypothetical protein [Salmonella enterica]EBL3084163.1 hypothetical protein [Salmonella enterica]